MEEFIDSKWERGNIFELLDMGMAFCFKPLNLNGRIRGLVREEHLEIPVEALREAMTNALCHSRYDHPSESIGLAIYDDRVEISNPGHFPPGVTPENIKAFHTSQPHNPKLAQVLYKATRIENWGSGIQRMVSACLNQELPEPDYQIRADGTIVIVFRKKPLQGHHPAVHQVNHPLTSKQQNETVNETVNAVLSVIRERPGIKMPAIVSSIGKSRASTARAIAELKTQGKIEFRGAPKTGGYYCKGV